MKHYVLLFVFLSCVLSAGALTGDEMKDLERLVQIDRIDDFTDKAKSGKIEVLKIEFSSEEEGLEDVWVRVAIELTDQEKKTYLVEEVRKNGAFPKDRYMGEGFWDVRMPHGSLGRLKVTGYAVEYGVREGEEFIPFLGEYEDVDTYEELILRTTTPFPGEIKFGRTVVVDSQY